MWPKNGTPSESQKVDIIVILKAICNFRIRRNYYPNKTSLRGRIENIYSIATVNGRELGKLGKNRHPILRLGRRQF